MLENNKGITLASLVVTIIVLLIITSVSIVSGRGTLDYVRFNNAKKQFETMQSQVYIWYEEYKNNAKVLEYGVELDDPSCDQEKAGLTASAVAGKDLTDYRYFTADYIKNSLDIEGIKYDFLINIKKRSVLLFGGIKYEGERKYSAEQFGINVVKTDEISGNISFEMELKDNNIYIYDIKFPNDMKISNYTVQYQLPDTTKWVTMTSDKKGTYVDGDENSYDAWIIESSIVESNIGTYKIRITTDDKDIGPGEGEFTVTEGTSE